MIYEVTAGEVLNQYETRLLAIEAAREMSSEYRGTVLVADVEDRERMTYQGGEMVSYDYETRRRRK